MADADQTAPVFSFDGAWPFTGDVKVNGQQVQSVNGFTVSASPDGIPVVTLTLVGPGALKLLLGAAEVQVDDQTRQALQSLGWTPPQGM